MRSTSLTPVFVEFISADLDPGMLYVSMEYATTVHLCACGCGNKVVLPLSPAEWQLHFNGESVSLSPSIGNWEYPCRSHYWIRNNRVQWAGGWTDEQVQRGRERDQRDLDEQFRRRAAASDRGWLRRAWRKACSRFVRNE